MNDLDLKFEYMGVEIYAVNDEEGIVGWRAFENGGEIELLEGIEAIFNLDENACVEFFTDVYFDEINAETFQGIIDDILDERSLVYEDIKAAFEETLNV